MNLDSEVITIAQKTDALALPASSPVLAQIPKKTQGALLRMFADPHLLGKEERGELVLGLRECVRAHPEVSELRVLYGMALCVDFKVPDAIEELREGLRLAPDSFIAQLKMGELWMRLRVCEKAEEHTHQAALLAQNLVQTEMARRQAAAIRELMRNGIKRPTLGYVSPFKLLGKGLRWWPRKREEGESLAAVEVR